VLGRVMRCLRGQVLQAPPERCEYRCPRDIFLGAGASKCGGLAPRALRPEPPQIEGHLAVMFDREEDEPPPTTKIQQEVVIDYKLPEIIGR